MEDAARVGDSLVRGLWPFAFAVVCFIILFLASYSQRNVSENPISEIEALQMLRGVVANWWMAVVYYACAVPQQLEELYFEHSIVKVVPVCVSIISIFAGLVGFLLERTVTTVLESTTHPQ